MKTLYLVRHGESEANKPKIIEEGHKSKIIEGGDTLIGSPLTKKGILQSLIIGYKTLRDIKVNNNSDSLKNIPIMMLSSETNRTFQTARGIFCSGERMDFQPFLTGLSSWLRERGFGDLERKSVEEVKTKFKNMSMEEMFLSDPEEGYPEFEPLRNIKYRNEKLINYLSKFNSNTIGIICGHIGIICI